MRGVSRPWRLGILGCGEIAASAVLEPAAFARGIAVTGVANRTIAKAQRLADHYGIPYVASSLEELLFSDEVDAVYIGLSNELHAEWAIRALAAGKHVLAEKPLALSAAELERLRQAKQAASGHGLKLTEALMVAHHPWQPFLKQLIASEEYGRLLKIETRISITAKDGHAGNYRSVRAKGGGSFWDLGCYWLQFLQAVVGLDGIEEVWGESDFAGPDGCDWSFRAGVQWTGGLEAACLTSFELPYKAAHRLVFEHAALLVPDIFRLNNGFHKFKLRRDDPESRAAVQEFAEMNYYVNQLEAFSLMLSDDLEDNFEAAAQRIELQLAMLEHAYRRGSQGAGLAGQRQS